MPHKKRLPKHLAILFDTKAKRRRAAKIMREGRRLFKKKRFKRKNRIIRNFVKGL